MTCFQRCLRWLLLSVLCLSLFCLLPSTTQAAPLPLSIPSSTTPMLRGELAVLLNLFPFPGLGLGSFAQGDRTGGIVSLVLAFSAGALGLTFFSLASAAGIALVRGSYTWVIRILLGLPVSVALTWAMMRPLWFAAQRLETPSMPLIQAPPTSRLSEHSARSLLKRRFY